MAEKNINETKEGLTMLKRIRYVGAYKAENDLEKMAEKMAELRDVLLTEYIKVDEIKLENMADIETAYRELISGPWVEAQGIIDSASQSELDEVEFHWWQEKLPRYFTTDEGKPLTMEQYEALKRKKL